MLFNPSLSKWVNTPAGNVIAMYGADPKSYAFNLQSLIMATMSKQRQNLSSSDVRIFERSIDTARYIFQKLLGQANCTPLKMYVLPSRLSYNVVIMPMTFYQKTQQKKQFKF